MMTGISNDRRHLGYFGRAVIACLILMLIISVGIASDKEKAPQSTTTLGPEASQSDVPTDQVKAPRPVGSSLVTMTTEQAARLTPLRQEMRRILISEQEQLAALYAEFAQATDSQSALGVQRRIHQVKTGTQISLLKAQAETAVAEGRLDDAGILEQNIETLTDPQRGQSTSGQAVRTDSRR